MFLILDYVPGSPYLSDINKICSYSSTVPQEMFAAIKFVGVTHLADFGVSKYDISSQFACLLIIAAE